MEKSGKNDFYANMTSARHDVMTSSTFFHNLICAYTISIFSDLFGEIQWEKSAKNDFYVNMTSARHGASFKTSFFRWASL